MDDVDVDLDVGDGLITVRRLTEGDRDEVELLCWTCASGLARWFDPGVEALSRSRSAAVVDGLLLGFDGPYGLTGAVRHNASGALIGLVSLQRRASRTVELTYWVARPWRGHGVATRAALLVSDVVLAGGSLVVERVEAIVDRRNEASARVAVKAGFVFAGTRAMPAPLSPGGTVDDLLFVRNR